MTKKHFIALANYIKDTEGYCESFTPRQVAHLANFCHSQNPNFDEKRWAGYILDLNGPSGGKNGPTKGK